MAKYTILKCHLPANSFDGYSAHRHLEVLQCSVDFYLNYILNKYGSLYPAKNAAELIINPWRVTSIRNQYTEVVGYDWMTDTSKEFPGIYALSNPGTNDGSCHDGLDVAVTDSKFGQFIKNIQSTNKNTNGYYGTAEVFEIDSSEVLKDGECWLNENGVWIRGSLRDGRSYYDAAFRDVQTAQGRQVTWNPITLSASYK